MYSARELSVAIGGRPAVALEQAAAGSGPVIVGAEVVPGMGMNVYQLRALLPGKGIVEMLEAPPIETAEHSPRVAGGILLPWANRMRGKVSSDARTIEVTLPDGYCRRTITLEANRKGKQAGAEPYAIHGLFLGRSMDEVNYDAGLCQASVSGSFDAGDFAGRWLSQVAVGVRAHIANGGFTLDVTARNRGDEPLPVGIGWHPVFVIPSGKRAQTRLRIPAFRRAPAHNYDDVFPTGVVVPVAGTAYDFSASGGAPLRDLYLDDCFLDLKRGEAGEVTAEMFDPAAQYGIRISTRSPDVRAIQVFAPLARNVVAIEPQFNLVDPFSEVWRADTATATGMVRLLPGEAVSYSAKVEVFVVDNS